MLVIDEAQANENESCSATRKAEEECGEYTYKAVRPLLKYIHQMKEEIENNNNRIEGKDREIKQLQEKLNQRNEFVIEQQIAQLDIYNKAIKELNSNVLSIKEEMGKLKTNDCENQLAEQRKSIDQKDQQIFKIENENNMCTNCSSFTYIAGDPDVLYDNATAGPGWIVIQQRINGKEDFYRNWATYREGFGNLDKDFFLGLERIHRLTSAQPHELYIHMEGFDDVIKYYRYEQFAIAGENAQYRLNLCGKAVGNATYDQLYYHNNWQFSTYDHNNCNCGLNCAHSDVRRGGWWHNSACGNSNLNGKFSDVGKASGMYWDPYKSLKKVKMLIRPNNYAK